MMLPRRSTILGGAALAAGAAAVPARAQLTIDMTRPTFEPVPIAIVDFAGDRVGADIANVVRNDLQNSGLFRSIPPSSFIQQDVNASAPPRFPDWRQIGAAGVVVGQVSQAGGNIKVDFRLWDVVVGNQAAGLSLHQPARQLAAARPHHRRRDLQARDRRGGLLRHPRRLCRRERPGQRARQAHRHHGPGRRQQPLHHRRPHHRASRRASRRRCRRSSTWPTREDRSPPRVYLQNVDTGRRELLGNFPGMSFAPRFSPDGTKVVMSIVAERPAATSTRWTCAAARCARLTNTPAIDTSPCYSNDGTQIVFNSDRGGSQQLYVMSAGGGGERRISFGEGRYATPVWSPRGDCIAFTKITGGSFGIGVMRPDGGGERMLATGFLVEGPTWAPNGRVLMFFRQQPNSARSRRLGHAAPDRHHRTLRTSDADADRCVGSGLVTLDSAVAKDMIFLVDPSAFLTLGSMLSGRR